MSEKQRFQEVLEEIRSDIRFLRNDLLKELSTRTLEHGKLLDFARIMGSMPPKGFSLPEELGRWIYDVFLDKWYETEAKIFKILSSLGVLKTNLSLITVKYYSQQIACKPYHSIQEIQNSINSLADAANTYEQNFENEMSDLR